MCSMVRCGGCGKATWSGCGLHIESALAGVPGSADRIRAAATVDGALARCDVIGGTAPARVAHELAAHEARLGLG